MTTKEKILDAIVCVFAVPVFMLALALILPN